jgi:hypothetical protein
MANSPSMYSRSAIFVPRNCVSCQTKRVINKAFQSTFISLAALALFSLVGLAAYGLILAGAHQGSPRVAGFFFAANRTRLARDASLFRPCRLRALAAVRTCAAPGFTTKTEELEMAKSLRTRLFLRHSTIHLRCMVPHHPIDERYITIARRTSRATQQITIEVSYCAVICSHDTPIWYLIMIVTDGGRE